MSSRVRRPEMVRLEISRGDWLLVKKHLTAGETRRIFGHMLKQGVDGREAIDPLKVGLSKMIVYLIDWSITDADDVPIGIRGEPETAIASALDMLEPEAFTEILHAIEAHDTAMEALRAEEKKTTDAAPRSAATWP